MKFEDKKAIQGLEKNMEEVIEHSVGEGAYVE